MWREAPSNLPGNFNLGFDEYTYPVYYAKDATGLVPVRLDNGAELNGKNIPWNPAWRPAPGDDAQVIILDTATMKQAARVKLRPGSTMAGGAWIGPEGKWAYVVHILGRFDLPITQLEQGWVHTYALSIIDVAAGTRLATVLLDDLTKGAADPWAVVGSADGKTLWISHRGVHEVSTLGVTCMHVPDGFGMELFEHGVEAWRDG